jgi:hypothetical protein
MTVPAEQLPTLIERMIRIETKLDVMNANHADHEARIRGLEVEYTPGGHQDHETRLRRLERSLWLMTGAAGAAGGIVAQLVAPLIK